MLTKRQNAILTYINRRISITGMSPTVREIGAALEMSIGNVGDALNGLEGRGFISRLRGKARGITVLILPEAARWSESILLREIVEHFKPELAALRTDCLDPDGGVTDPSLMEFIAGGEALIARAEAMVGDGA